MSLIVFGTDDAPGRDAAFATVRFSPKNDVLGVSPVDSPA